MSKQADISEIVFRNEQELKEKNLELNDVGHITEYLIDKLRGAPPLVKDYDLLLAQGVVLMQKIQEHYCSGENYSSRLKADIAEYASEMLTHLLKVEELDEHGRFQKGFDEQLKNNGAVFNYSSQIVDALLELAVGAGAIKRDVIKPWKKLKEKYAQGKNNQLIHDAYGTLVHMKSDFRERYEHFHNLALREGNKR